MITPIYAGILTLFFIGLSVQVMRGRQEFKIPIGDAGEKEMLRRMRAQANFAEYTPLFIILLAFAEHGGLPAYAVHIFGVIYLLGRCSHAYSILKFEPEHHYEKISDFRYRSRGMEITIFSLALLAMIILAQRLWIAI